jgi:hypothetical protein
MRQLLSGLVFAAVTYSIFATTSLALDPPPKKGSSLSHIPNVLTVSKHA